MALFMAGAHSTGAVVASSRVESRSLARPLAVLPMMSAVAGATATTSAQRARSTCSMMGLGRHSWYSGLAPKQGWPVREARVSGVMNREPASVRQQRTTWPRLVRVRASSAPR